MTEPQAIDEPTSAEDEQRLLVLLRDLDAFSSEFRVASKLNIFEAVGLQRQEIKHSNFLAYLLSPLERHGIGDAFLKGLVSKIFDNLQSAPPMRPLTFLLSSFEDSVVLREWRNIDILIESKANNFVLAIENKIDASEGEDQLVRYEQAIDASFAGYNRVFAYLTPSGAEPPSSARWSSISYADVIQALSTAASKAVAPEIQIAVEHYVDLIRRNLVPDQELIEQCRRIYAKHRQALDLIYRYGEVSSFQTAVTSFFKEHSELVWTAVKPNRAAFLPSSIFEVTPEVDGLNWFGQSRPILFWFFLESNKFGLVIEVGPYADQQHPREPFVCKLLDHFKSNAKIYPKYTRVFTKRAKLNDEQSGDADKLRDDMEKFYQEAAQHLTAIRAIVTEYFGEEKLVT